MNYMLLSPNARCPTKNKGDAGYDLYTPIDFDLYPGEIRVIDIGFACELPEGYYAKIFGRSKLASQGLEILGGVIDETYRGSWGIVLKNTNPDSTLSFRIGDRIAQFIIMKYEEMDFQLVEKLSDSSRGDSGIWSKGRT